MFETNWDFNRKIDGIIDTGILVIAHFNNPLQEEMIELLGEVLSGKINALIPLSTVIGSYHILTSYLKVAKLEAKKALQKTLETRSDNFFPFMDITTVHESLDISAVYGVESWDGYLIGLANLFKTRNIYTIDKKLKKVPTINVILPIEETKLKEYHEFLEATIFKK